MRFAIVTLYGMFLLSGCQLDFAPSKPIGLADPGFDCAEKNPDKLPPYALSYAGRLMCRHGGLAALEKARTRLFAEPFTGTSWDAEWWEHITGRYDMTLYSCEDRNCVEEGLLDYLDTALNLTKKDKEGQLRRHDDRGSLRILELEHGWYAFKLFAKEGEKLNAVQGLLKLSGERVSFRDKDADCSLEFSKIEGGWQVTQQGLCGYEADVASLAGTYKAAPQ